LIGSIWLLSTRFIELPGTLNRNPVAASAMLLFFWFILGASYTSATSGEAFSMVMKYRELLFIPIFISILTTEHYRDWAWKAFFIASILALFVSYLMHFGILDLNKQGDSSFKNRIAHSVFISFFAFYCLHKAYDSLLNRKLYLALFVLSLYNLFFVVPGRTGQLIVIALILLFSIQRFGNKQRLLIILAIGLSLTLYLNFSDKSSRISEGIANTKAYLQPVPEQTESSMGLRYGWWKSSLKLMSEKPLLGHGTGSYSKEYQRLVPDELLASRNPHNEFLMIGVQLGLIGLFIYLSFLASQYYYAKKLPNKEKWFAQGILLSLIITSVFNSPLLDHNEGHWFATMIAICFASLHGKDKAQFT
jgi:O-antigen ligase